jgi:membrane associated rhomboid family serine protease
MNLDEARREWQSQTILDETRISEDELMETVKRNSSAFDRAIARRDRREAITAIVVMIVFLPMLVTGPWLTRAGVVVVLGAFALIFNRLGAARRLEASERVDLSLAELLESERAKVDGQIRLLESVVSWYIIPPAVGAMLIVIGLEGLSWFTAAYAVFALAIALLVYRLNQQAVRRDLRPTRSALERLIRELKG